MTARHEPAVPGTARELLVALLEVSRQEVELLTAEDWEAAVAMHDRFEALYAAFERAGDADPLTTADVPALQQLADSHGEAIRLAEALKSKAGSAIASIASAQPVVGAYAPLGATHKPGPRFLDHEA